MSSQQPQQQQARASTKCARACEYCRVKKIKCDSRQPCENCVLHGEECHTVPVARKSTRERYRLLLERADRAEALLRAAGIPNPEHSRNSVQGSRGGSRPPSTATPLRTKDDRHTSLLFSPPFSLDHDHGMVNGQSNMKEAEHQTAVVQPADNRVDGGFGDHALFPPSPPTTLSTATSRGRTSLLSPLSEKDSDSDRRPSPQGPALTACDRAQNESNVEVHGPGSYLSICSDPGVEWVSQKIGQPDFNASATNLAFHVARSLKLHGSLQQVRTPEPDPESAWAYTQAYFEDCLEVGFEAIHRPAFEARLRTHIAGEDVAEQDPAWYALRNVVYAFGSRIFVHQHSFTNAWIEAQNKSWHYFENALSVHTELVYFRSDISAVQALLMMALFVEGVGCPKLEYMLVSNAMRLAQSKGLHLHPAPSCQIPEFDLQHRRWLFWSIYLYEKHIAYRSGRLSAIDDDEITCPAPTVSPNGVPLHVEIFQHYIHHAQISSSTMKNLSLTKVRQQDPTQVIKTVDALDQRLRSWYANIPQYLKPKLPLKVRGLSQGIALGQIIYLHCAYNGSLIAIHSVFGYPWNSLGFEPSPDANLRGRVESSTNIVAEASRNLILATRQVSIDAAAPAWMIFYYPILGMINLFIYILRFPSNPTVALDIQLIDMVAGYFGYLDFSTSSHLSFPFTRDIAHWARVVVEKAKANQNNAPVQAMPAQHTTMDEFPNTTEDEVFDAQSRLMQLTDSALQIGNMDSADMGIDDWPAFLSSMAQVSSMAWNDPRMSRGI